MECGLRNPLHLINMTCATSNKIDPIETCACHCSTAWNCLQSKFQRELVNETRVEKNWNKTKWKRHAEMKRTKNYVSVAHNLSLNAHMMVCAGRQSAKIEISKKYVHVLAVFQLADAIAFTIAHASISSSHFRWKCTINYFVISAFLPSGVGLTAMKMAHTRPAHHTKRDNLSATIYTLSFFYLRPVLVCVREFGTSPNRHFQN